MAKRPAEFDIGPADEMQRAHGWNVENWEAPEVDAANVPDTLRHLARLAKRWGITCDVTRHDAGRHATQDELAQLRDQLRGTHALYEDWAFGALAPFNAQSHECSVFGAMYRFEAEECGGPGIRSKLDWAIRRFQNSPDASNRERLQSALDWVVAKGRRFVRSRQTSVDLAQELLDRAKEISAS
jgi:hypothetical protein